MDNYLGDLADIVRASGGVNNNNPTTTTTTTRTAASGDQMSTWDFGSPDSRTSNTHQSYEYNDLYTFSDPLLPDIDPISSPGPFSLNMGAQDGSNDNTISTEAFSSNTGLLLQQQQMQQAAATISEIYHLGHEYQPKLAQISPSNIPSHSNNNNNNNNNRNNNCNSNNSNNNSNNNNNNNNYVAKRSFGFMSSETVGVNNASSSSSPKEGFIGGSIGVHHQIPSPRNSGIKRRKSQAKKVVCIPATGAANSRQTGEVVPSDLWAWRKYGQKPIKGSPYPRGYYRCSSSKGCSARKQVERSRTDPNMLVITYTSEHNHPWPTQRNALAGSSRSSHPSKEKTLVKDEINDKEEQYDVDTRNGPIQSPANYAASGNPSKKSSLMKEEEATTMINDVQVQNKLEENNVLDYEGDDHQLVHNNKSYRPTIQQCDQDFFKDLVEFEGGDDPLNLLFAQEAKGSDPLFSGFFDWTTQNFATTKDVVDDCDPNNGSTSR